VYGRVAIECSRVVIEQRSGSSRVDLDNRSNRHRVDREVIGYRSSRGRVNQVLIGKFFLSRSH